MNQFMKHSGSFSASKFWAFFFNLSTAVMYLFGGSNFFGMTIATLPDAAVIGVGIMGKNHARI